MASTLTDEQRSFYEDARARTKTEIEDRLRQRRVQMLLGKPPDPGAVSFDGE